MMKYFYTLIIALVFFSVGTEAYFCITGQVSHYIPSGTSQRIVFYFSFFTVLSTLALGIGCLIVIFKPNYQSHAITILRVDGVIGVIITGIIYNFVLRALYHPDLLILKITNECLHVVIPLLGVIGWLAFDPHNRITKRSIIYAVIPPIIYVVYIFVRGSITGLYPYPILDINQIGYVQALINTLIIAIIFIVFAIALYFIDNYWPVKR